jgi:hypothetical protein
MATKSGGKKGGKKSAGGSSRKQGSSDRIIIGDAPMRAPGSPILITGGSITVEFPEGEGYFQDPSPLPGFEITLINPTAIIAGISIYDGRTYKPGESTNVPLSTFTVPAGWGDKCVVEIQTALPE